MDGLRNRFGVTNDLAAGTPLTTRRHSECSVVHQRPAGSPLDALGE